MDMKVVKSEKKLCPCCMEEHEVKTILMKEQATFKNSKLEYEALYWYCDATDELYMDERQMKRERYLFKRCIQKKRRSLNI